MTDAAEAVRAQLAHCLETLPLSIPGEAYQGKVRETFKQGDRMLIITTDRVSAFDHVLGTVPFKGQILAEIALEAFRQTEDLCPNHIIEAVHPNAWWTRLCQPYPIEFVVRGYLSGSLWRAYAEEGPKAGAIYGVALPEGLKANQKLPEPILTPTTKEDLGQHDMPISPAGILERGLMTEAAFEAVKDTALQLFARGSEVAKARGLILVDTKYELGTDPEGRLTVIDEIHTPDSSRYWVAEGYEARFQAGQAQRMLDKENLRAWLLAEGFDGHGDPPKLTDAIRQDLALAYIEVYEKLLGRPFEAKVGPVLPGLKAAIERP